MKNLITIALAIIACFGVSRIVLAQEHTQTVPTHKHATHARHTHKSAHRATHKSSHKKPEPSAGRKYHE